MPKIRIQVTIREDIVKWMDKQVETRKQDSRSHAIEYAVLQLRKWATRNWQTKLGQ
jgi:Arc/MetJ-type ribon-helix-helix transcriptional regulator